MGISEILFSKLMHKEVASVNSLKTLNFVTNTFAGYFLPMLMSLFAFINVLVVEKLKVLIRKNKERVAVLSANKSLSVSWLKNRIK